MDQFLRVNKSLLKYTMSGITVYGSGTKIVSDVLRGVHELHFGCEEDAVSGQWAGLW